MSVAEATQLLKCSVGEQTRLEILPMGFGKNIYHLGIIQYTSINILRHVFKEIIQILFLLVKHINNLPIGIFHIMLTLVYFTW